MKDLAGLLPFVLIALVFWLLIVRPQRRRQQNLQQTQSQLQPGTEVMLGSGIYGRVAELGDDRISLELSPGVTVQVARQAVARVIDETPDQTDDTYGTNGTDDIQGPEGDDQPGRSGSGE